MRSILNDMEMFQEAPAAIGPYSQAVKVGSLVFVSLCGPLLPESGNVVDGGIKEQTVR
jgi:2-iminobutanoate/2-iminopropanoate deaminase